MTRTPAALLYLTIYNPTIRPNSTVDEDNEDAEEQAQILFYTSRDQATSRDKTLRQVGLAKALIHFAETFQTASSYQNVHSQSRRMVMLSPEPNFWIHAAIELAKTLQAQSSKSKSKDKEKAKEASSGDVPAPECLDGSLHDSAIRAHLLRGYEQFKIIHGSFTSILHSQGQQALELQLERFFTIWAWSWDLEADCNLSLDLGPPLHPIYPSILPAIDTFSSHLPEGLEAIVLIPDHVAPSSRYRSLRYPTALARHLMSLSSRSHHEANAKRLPPERPSEGAELPDNSAGPSATADAHASNGFPGATSKAADVRKWGWPGAFLLSRNSGKKSGSTTSLTRSNSPGSLADSSVAPTAQDALDDAISHNSLSSNEPQDEGCPHGDLTPSTNGDMSPCDSGQRKLQSLGVETPRPSRAPSPTLTTSEAMSSSPSVADNCKTSNRVHFTFLNVFLAPGDEPWATCRHSVALLKRDDIAVALISGGDKDRIPNDIEALASQTSQLLEQIDVTLSEDAKRTLDSSLPSATKILQPQDAHLMKSHGYIAGGTGLSSHLDLLYDAKELLEKQPDNVEVFSRGLTPQHWHVVHREDDRGEIYLQVARKETSLSDVDNVVQKLYKGYA
ncbi:hypothetical protein EDD17DRAFT_1584363 [Pisolithus thermaeus]|nr:hypothetical protein EDD17DRAFT_1584363 [Pisolithus thermaeus]